MIFNTRNARMRRAFRNTRLRPRKANASALHVVFHELHSLARCVARAHLRAPTACADVRYVQRTHVDFNARNARMRRSFRNTRASPMKSQRICTACGFSRVAQILHATSHGHISVLRQRALMYDMCKGLHVDFNTGKARRCVELFVTLELRPRKANASAKHVKALHVVFHESHSLARYVARAHLHFSSGYAIIKLISAR